MSAAAMRTVAFAGALLAGGLRCSAILAESGQVPDATVLARAQELRNEQHDEQATALLQGFLGAHPDDVDVLVALAKVRYDDGDEDRAKELLTHALAVSPNSEPANVALGNILLAEHHDPEAMDRFEAVLAIDLRNGGARKGELAAATELAIRMRREGRPELALTALQHARANLPDDPQLLLDLGIQASELGRTDEAIDALEKARQMMPSNPTILYALAHAQFDAQHMQRAAALFDAYLALRPDDASAHFGLGRVYEVQNEFDKARPEFERSIALQPVQTESYYELGDMDVKSGDDAAAVPLLEKALARDALHGGALTDMGEISFHRGDYAAAARWLQQAVDAAPDYAQAHYYRALTLLKLGRKQEAAAEFKEATRLDRSQELPSNRSNAAPTSQAP